jgi:hypothetical protein
MCFEILIATSVANVILGCSNPVELVGTFLVWGTKLSFSIEWPAEIVDEVDDLTHGAKQCVHPLVSQIALENNIFTTVSKHCIPTNCPMIRMLCMDKLMSFGQFSTYVMNTRNFPTNRWVISLSHQMIICIIKRRSYHLFFCWVNDGKRCVIPSLVICGCSLEITNLELNGAVWTSNRSQIETVIAKTFVWFMQIHDESLESFVIFFKCFS